MADGLQLDYVLLPVTVKCDSPDQALGLSVEGVRSCSHGKRVSCSMSCRKCCSTPEISTETGKYLG